MLAAFPAYKLEPKKPSLQSVWFEAWVVIVALYLQLLKQSPAEYAEECELQLGAQASFPLEQLCAVVDWAAAYQLPLQDV